MTQPTARALGGIVLRVGEPDDARRFPVAILTEGQTPRPGAIVAQRVRVAMSDGIPSRSRAPPLERS